MLKHPMKKPGIAINSARCMACYACFMACKDEHCGWDTDLSKSQPEMGQYWMNIKEWERGDNERHIKTATVPTVTIPPAWLRPRTALYISVPTALSL